MERTIVEISTNVGRVIGIATLLALLGPVGASAQCTGDCDGDGTVSIAELIRGVNINLGNQSVDVCSAFDSNGDGTVAVNELIQGVNANLNGCPAVTPATETPEATPTATPEITETPEPTPTATATEPPSGDCGNGTVEGTEECDDGKHCIRGDETGESCTEDGDCGATPSEGSCVPRDGDGCQSNCLLPVCGDGVVDTQDGETCDDGNTDEGFDDRCPSNCSIAECVPSGDTITVNVDFAASQEDTFAAGLELFVRYADGTVGIPGSADAQSVRDRIASPGNVFPSITPNDRDYGLVLVLLDPSLFGADPGTAVTVELDTCEGASAPTADDFMCSVNSASDENLNDITDVVSCEVVLP